MAIHNFYILQRGFDIKDEKQLLFLVVNKFKDKPSPSLQATKWRDNPLPLLCHCERPTGAWQSIGITDKGNIAYLIWFFEIALFCL
jgi:hypothetical protein